MRHYLLVKHHLKKLASACDQYGVSDKAGATIATTVLEDFCVVNPQDTSHDIDSSKIQ